MVSFPNNTYNFLRNVGSFAYSSLKPLLFSQKTQVSAETREKLEENWVFVLHSYKHNEFIEKIRENEENPQFLFTRSAINLQTLRNSSVLVENLENGSEIREFPEKSRDFSDNWFQFLEEVPDYDDLDYAVVMSEEEMQRIFAEYLEKTEPNFKEIGLDYQRISAERYPIL